MDDVNVALEKYVLYGTSRRRRIMPGDKRPSDGLKVTIRRRYNNATTLMDNSVISLKSDFNVRIYIFYAHTRNTVR